jgi:hemolysin activation/secretion protein
MACALLIAEPVRAAGVGLPDAGTILHQAQPLAAPTFSTNHPGLLSIQTEGKITKLPSSDTFLLRGIIVTNNTIFDTEKLTALVADAQGKNLALSQLVDLASRITDYYRSHGYPLVLTIIPAQTIVDGILRIKVIEPRYGKISINNQSRTSSYLLRGTLAKLQSGNFIEESDLDHSLLLLSDIPGIIVVPNLKIGAENSTSDLEVNTSSGPVISGQLGLNNHGSKYTGAANLSGSVVVNNPLQHGDTVTFNTLGSGPGMNYQSIAYDTLLNGSGTHVGASSSSLNYQFNTNAPAAVATDNSALDGSGSARASSLWIKQALVRSRNKNVYGHLRRDLVKLRDHLDAGSNAVYTDRHFESFTASLSGDFRDTLVTPGITAWSLDTSAGRLAFDNSTAQEIDKSAAKTSGSFVKITGSLLHIKSLGRQSELVIGLKGQWANSNLDSSQKMLVGGSYSVRAYSAGAISGDVGYFLNTEYKQPISIVWGGPLSATAFIDTATVLINKKLWPGAGLNKATLSGAGIGIHWAGPQQYTGTAYLAIPIGSKPSMLGSVPSAQFSIDLQKRF